MKSFVKSLLFSLALSVIAVNSWAASITAVRSWRAPDNTRLVLDLSEQVLYRQINTNNSKQIVIELDDTSSAVSTLALPTRIGLVQNVLLESMGSKQRLIINLSGEVKPKVFMLAANEKLGSRLVIDLYDKVVMQAVSPPTIELDTLGTNQGRSEVVVVDAGHGGEDSGAIGATGHYEKHVTLAIAKKLVAILRKQDGFKAYLTRDSDYFIPLVERRKIARNRYKADIFISIHADAALSPLAKGASVFALSRKGANVATSRFAQALAERENKSDLIGGVDNRVGQDAQLSNILADMVVEGSVTHSLHMGSGILNQMGDLTKLHSKRVEQAGFAVLKEAGMISLLVETGFMTNAEEEAKLITSLYQQQMAQAIFSGLHGFVNNYPMSQTYFAWNKEQRNRKYKKVALAFVGAPPPKVIPAAEKLIDKPEQAINKPDNIALLASFSQTKPTVAPKLVIEPAPKPAPKIVEQPLSKARVKAILPNSLDDFIAGTEPIKAVSKKPPPKVVIEPKPKTPPKKPIRHTVVTGDSLSSIALKYGVSMQALRDTNKLKNDNVLLNTALKIPNP